MGTQPSLFPIALLLAACGPSKEQAAAEPIPSQAAATSTASATASPSATSTAATAIAPPAGPPVLVPVEKHKTKEGYQGVWAIDGALVVASGLRVGRLTDDKVDYFGSVHSPTPGWSSLEITSISGRYPGSIDAMYHLREGRALMAGWEAVSGSVDDKYREDFGILFFAGMARVGNATFVAGSFHQATVLQVRGEPLDRTPTSPADAGCTEKEIEGNSPVRKDAAIEPWTYGSTQGGTIISIGNLCRERGVHAEIWPPNGDKPKIVSLEKLVHKEYLIEILGGPGDVAWVVDGELPRLIEYRGGEFRALPALPRKMFDAAVSNDGMLYVTDGTKIYRLQDGAWKHLGSLPWSTDFYTFAAYDGALWATSGASLYKLEPGEGIGSAEGCKTPFVRLYDVSDKSELGYTFPTTTKALSTFADVEKISLVEYIETRRRLGITVPSKEIGEAVIAHVKANMKGEDPDLVCYEPKSPRAIKIPKAKSQR